MRYFYTDPLAAEWMMDKFGMEFETDKGQRISIFDGFFLAENDRSNIDKAYIHPDSMHLLEPQVGDLVSECGNFHIAESSCEPQFIIPITNYSKAAKIIQRNGMAFHWPESEAA